MSEPDPAGRAAVRRDLILLALSCALFFGIRLGARDLWNPNEPIYGEAVREMAQRGSWLIPYVNGKAFGEKPILYFWLALAASKAAGGVSELTLRIPSLLAGLAVVLGAYALVLPYAGRTRALATALVAATSYAVWSNARAAQMDILVTASTLWTVVPLVRALDFGAGRWRAWIAAGAAAGLGFLAKGPVGVICPGLVMVSYAAATRRLRELVRVEVLAGVAVAAAVAAPWFVALAAHGRTDLLHEVLIRQNFRRFTNPWDHVAPFWYYLPYLFIDFAPWSFLAPLAWKQPGRGSGERRLALLAGVWIASIVLFFSLSKSKRDPYILPIAPAAAVFGAEVAVAYARGRLSRARAMAVRATALAFAAIFAVAGAVIALKVPAAHPPLAVPAFVFAGVTLTAGAVVAGIVALRRRGRAVPVALGAATGAVLLVAGVSTLPAADAVKSARPLCERVAALAGPGDTIASYNFWKWRAEFRFYLRRPVVNLPGPEPLREAWNGPKRVVLLVGQDQLASARAVIGAIPPAFVRRVGSMATYVFVSRRAAEPPLRGASVGGAPAAEARGARAKGGRP